PASARATASGFARIRVRSTAMRPPTLAESARGRGRAARALRLRAKRHRLFRGDRRLAVRADLPRRVERAAARRARLAELRRAHGADEVVGADRRAADRAGLPVLAEAPLDRL